MRRITEYISCIHNNEIGIRYWTDSFSLISFLKSSVNWPKQKYSLLWAMIVLVFNTLENVGEESEGGEDHIFTKVSKYESIVYKLFLKCFISFAKVFPKHSSIFLKLCILNKRMKKEKKVKQIWHYICSFINC